MVFKMSTFKEIEIGSYSLTGRDSFINVVGFVAVAVLPLEFVQNYRVVPLLMGTCSFGWLQRKRILWWDTWGAIQCFGPPIGFWQSMVFITPCKLNPFFFFFSLYCFLHKFDPGHSHFFYFYNSPLITSFVFFFFRFAIYVPPTGKGATVRHKQRMTSISYMFCSWNSYYDIGPVHSEISMHEDKKLKLCIVVPMSLIEPRQYHSTLSWFLLPISELEASIIQKQSNLIEVCIFLTYILGSLSLSHTHI